MEVSSDKPCKEEEEDAGNDCPLDDFSISELSVIIKEDLVSNLESLLHGE